MGHGTCRSEQAKSNVNDDARNDCAGLHICTSLSATLRQAGTKSAYRRGL